MDYSHILTIYDKKFGKNFVSYKFMSTSENQLIEEGKCNDHVGSRAKYKELMDVYGEENILLLMK